MEDKKDKYNANEIISDDTKGYFAAKSAKLCVQTLIEKTESYYQTLKTKGYFNKITDMFYAWHGSNSNNIGDAHSINFGGEDGETTEIIVNHIRNIGDHMISMTTANRPALETRAINPDYKSQVQTKLGNGLLDYYMREAKLENYLNDACKGAVVLGSGWIKLGWNDRLGKVKNQKEIQKAKSERLAGMKSKIPEPEYEGDVEFKNLSALDVIEDLNKENEDHDWRIARSFKNKYDLIATYPEFSDAIMTANSNMIYNKFLMYSKTIQDNDDVAIFEFYHKRTESMPDGRYILYVNDNAILYDGPLPYRSIPLYSMKPDRILGTPLGYTILFDLLPLQDAANMLYSTILSNQAAFGIQNILVPTGCNIDPTQISGGLNILKYNPQAGEPSALQLTKTPPEVFEFVKMIVNAMETISGINSSIRGNPEANLRSAAAIAMIESNAIQYMSNLQKQYIHLMENVGKALIETLVDFAHSPRIASIVGINDRAYTREFKGEDLAEINRVVVDVANPLSKTIAGRINAAEQLIQYGKISPEQYMNVINTGKLEVATDGIINAQMLIQMENEYILRGEKPIAIAIDQHLAHIKGHSGVISDPSLRKDTQLVQIVLEHINEHIRLLKETDPELLMSIGEQPLTPTQPQQPNPSPSNNQDGSAIEATQNLPPEQAQLEALGTEVPNVRLPEGFKDIPLTPQENIERIQGQTKEV